MTSSSRLSSTGDQKKLRSFAVSVERPIIRNGSSYTLRYCVRPDLPEIPAVWVKEVGEINRSHHQHHKSNITPTSSAFEIVEVVRPFSGNFSEPSNRASIASQSSVKANCKRDCRTSQLLATANSLSPFSCSHRTGQNERLKGRSGRISSSSNLARELFCESGTVGFAMSKAPSSADGAVMKCMLNRTVNNDHDGSGFKRISGSQTNTVGLHRSVQSKARSRPWKVSDEPFPMKYFMNGVRISGNPSDAIVGDVRGTSINLSALETGLRPSLFSFRRHHDGLHGSLKSLLKTPERVKMSKEAALNFIQGQVDVWYAACQGDSDLVAAYIDAGVIVDALDRRYGRTPLQYAAGNNNTAIMRLLLQAGADVNAEGSRDILSNTPLHFAAMYGKTEAAHHLLDSDADCTIANANGATPLRLAFDNGHSETATLLKKYGAALGP
jgi:hypothetical protein